MAYGAKFVWFSHSHSMRVYNLHMCQPWINLSQHLGNIPLTYTTQTFLYIVISSYHNIHNDDEQQEKKKKEEAVEEAINAYMYLSIIY